MRMPGMGELLIILVIVMLVFGANKLPQLGDGIGKAIKNLKRGIERDDELDITPTDHRVAAEPRAKVIVDASDADGARRRRAVACCEFAARGTH